LNIEKRTLLTHYFRSRLELVYNIVATFTLYAHLILFIHRISNDEIVVLTKVMINGLLNSVITQGSKQLSTSFSELSIPALRKLKLSLTRLFP
jgi:hypothetical protein